MITQFKMIVIAITAALLAGVSYAAEIAGSSPSSSTSRRISNPLNHYPPTVQLTIKDESSPHVAPPTEDKKVTPATDTNASESARKLPKGVATGTINLGGSPGNTWDPVNNCYIGEPPANYRCPPSQKIVDRLCNPFSVNFCGGGHDVGVTG